MDTTRTRDLEKEEFDHVSERANRTPSGDVAPTSTDSADHGFTSAEQKKIIRHVDRRLVVTVGIMYCVSLMDRTNLSNAAIAGMREELDLYVDNRYVSTHRVFIDRPQETSVTDVFATEHRLSHLLHPVRLELPPDHTAMRCKLTLPLQLHHLPASQHHPRAQARPQNPSLLHLPRLGRRHDRNGLLAQLRRPRRHARHPRHPRGRLLSQLCLPSQHVVHPM